MLSVIEWIYGTTQLAAVFLSIIAGLIAISMYRHTRKHPDLAPWNYLIVVLVLFAITEVLGGLAIFGVYRTPHLTHVTASVALGFLIVALVKKINVTKGWTP